MKRPLLISIICVIGFIGAILTPIGLFTSSVSPVGVVAPSIQFPTWYIIFSLVLALVYLFGLIEIWKMRKRGIELYTITAIVEYIIGFTFSFASFAGLIISIIAIGLIWMYYKRMTSPSFLSPKIQP
jgi:hypothetical protein